MGVLSILLCLAYAGVAQGAEPHIFVLADGSVIEAEILAELDTSFLIQLPDGTRRRLGLDQVVEVIGDEGVLPVGQEGAASAPVDDTTPDDALLQERVWVDVVPAQGSREPAAAAEEVPAAVTSSPSEDETEAVGDEATPGAPAWSARAEELPMETPVADEEPEVVAAASPVGSHASDGVEVVQVEPAAAVEPAEPVEAARPVDLAVPVVPPEEVAEPPTDAAARPLAIPAGEVGAVLGREPGDSAPAGHPLVEEERAVSLAPAGSAASDAGPEEVEGAPDTVEPSPKEASLVSPPTQAPTPLSEALTAGSTTTMKTARPRFGIGTGISGGAWAQPGGSVGSYDLLPLELRFYSASKEGRSLDVVLNWFHGTGAGGPGTTWTAGVAVYQHRRRVKNGKVSLAFAPGGELAFGGVTTALGVEPIMGLWGHLRMGVDLQPFGDRTEWGVYARPSTGFMADLSGNSGFAGLMAGIVVEVTGTWLAR